MNLIVITYDVFENARIFFEERGSLGYEGTAMIVASQLTGTTRLVIPDQRAGRAPRCWVEVTDQGKLDLAIGLGPDDVYVARIHSHPMDAFHSAVDDANPALTHEGAVSIVVPYFGLGLRLGFNACAVYQLQHKSKRWQELPVGPARDQVVVIR